jgi:transposase
MDIKSLHREGHSIKAVARMTGRSRNTVRKVVRQARPDPMRKQRRRSLLDAFKAYVETRFRECELSAVRLLAEIRPMGYAGSLHTLRRFVSSLRADRRGRQKLTVRFETPPGKQAQVDWFYCGRFPDATGRLVRIYGFLMVLGFSRMLYVEFTRSMKVPELIRCHLNAFRLLRWLAAGAALRQHGPGQASRRPLHQGRGAHDGPESQHGAQGSRRSVCSPRSARWATRDRCTRCGASCLLCEPTAEGARSSHSRKRVST